MLRKVSHIAAVNALKTIRNADSFNVLAVDEDAFDRTCEQFRQYSDQQISFVDHTSAILATYWDITHVFTFDRDDFQTLGFTVVPGASGEA